MGSISPMWRGKFWGEKWRPIVTYRDSQRCCELCKNGWTNWDAVWDFDWGGSNEALLDGVHIGTTWRIWLNCPRAEVMQPFVKLIWPLVTIIIIIISTVLWLNLYVTHAPFIFIYHSWRPLWLVPMFIQFSCTTAMPHNMSADNAWQDYTWKDIGWRLTVSEWVGFNVPLNTL